MALDKFFIRFSNPMTIYVDPDMFHFTSGTQTIQFGTYLYLKKVDGKYIYHSAGKEAPTRSEVVRIDLFRNSELPPGVNRMEVFEAYLRYGVQQLTNKSRIIRPVVTVKNIQSLDSVLMGYQNALMKPVLLEAGAWKVQFE